MDVNTTLDPFQYGDFSSSVKSLITQSTESTANTTENPMLETDRWFKKMEEVVSIVVPIFFSMVVLVGFIGNLLVVSKQRSCE